MSKHIVAALGCAAAAGLCAAPALAQSAAQNLPPVEVQQKKPKPVKRPALSQAPAQDAGQPASAEAAYEKRGLTAPLSGGTIQGETLKAEQTGNADTASMLRAVPGVNMYTAGGVSSLPDIHGFNDDRVNTTLNGMTITAACANHMNPVLSFADPSVVKKIDVMAGISPVSAGGDSLGSVVAVETVGPVFAAAGEVISHGSITGFTHSNGGGVGGSVSVSSATANTAISYTGSTARSNDYVDGHGDKVGSTMYQASNHAMSLAWRGNGELLIVDAGIQKVPWQGFPNQWMDMTNNEAWFINSRYKTKLDWGKLDLQAYVHHISHEMDFLADKGDGRQLSGRMPTMPMWTDGTNLGYKVKAEIPTSSATTVRVGNELHAQLYDEWWPWVPKYDNNGNLVPGSMCCDDFWNIKAGQRFDLGTYAEIESKWPNHWTTLVGVRNDTVWMNAGDIHGYSDVASTRYPQDAAAFNSRNHAKTDINFNITAQARYEPDANSIYEFGLSRKTRSPNMYERYMWSTNGMAMAMMGWYGDSNRYVGNLDLKPETANTASFTAGWHDAARRDWELKVTPYFSYVEDYINATPFAFNGYKNQDYWIYNNSPYYLLRFTNQNAAFYGADLSGSKLLADSWDYGRLTLSAKVNYTHGEALSPLTYTTYDAATKTHTQVNLSHYPLYHMMPLNARIALEHKLGHWTSVAELELVAEKNLVDPARLEQKTAAYALVNLRTSYDLGYMRFDLGVRNLFDQYYEPPLGGAYIGYFSGTAPVGSPVDAKGRYGNVAGMGRDAFASVTFKF